ncbi:hypothetical protein [Bacteroides pyogenes]|nr:hypothetical protein [Bacteroides pyogenes]
MVYCRLYIDDIPNYSLLEGFSFEPTTTPRGLFYGAKVLLWENAKYR